MASYRKTIAAIAIGLNIAWLTGGCSGRHGATKGRGDPKATVASIRSLAARHRSLNRPGVVPDIAATLDAAANTLCSLGNFDRPYIILAVFDMTDDPSYGLFGIYYLSHVNDSRAINVTDADGRVVASYKIMASSGYVVKHEVTAFTANVYRVQLVGEGEIGAGPDRNGEWTLPRCATSGTYLVSLRLADGTYSGAVKLQRLQSR